MKKNIRNILSILLILTLVIGTGFYSFGNDEEIVEPENMEEPIELNESEEIEDIEEPVDLDEFEEAEVIEEPANLDQHEEIEKPEVVEKTLPIMPMAIGSPGYYEVGDNDIVVETKLDGQSTNTHTMPERLWAKDDYVYVAVKATHELQYMQLNGVRNVGSDVYDPWVNIFINGVKYVPDGLTGNTKDSHWTVFKFELEKLNLTEDGKYPFFIKGIGGGHDVGGKLLVEIPKEDVMGKKVWEGGTDRESIKLQLKRKVGNDPLELVNTVVVNGSETTPWTYTWEQVPKYDPYGRLYEYSVDEETVPYNYYKVIEGLTVKNIYRPDAIQVFKGADRISGLCRVYEVVLEIKGIRPGGVDHLATDGAVVDVIGDEFDLIEDSLPAGATYDEANRIIAWKVGTITERAELSYRIKAKPEFEGGTASTNEYAKLTYTDFNGNEGREKDFPIPEVQVPTFLEFYLTDVNINLGDSIYLGMGMDANGENYMSPITGGDGDGTYTYEWRIKGESAVFSDKKNPNVNPKEDTEYELTVIDSNNCKTVGSMWVRVNKIMDIGIYKFDKDTKASLDGAEFVLKKDGKEIKRITTMDGYGWFEGILPGTYTLEEVKAPKGYRLEKTIYTVVIGVDGVIETNPELLIDKDREGQPIIKIPNSKSAELPRTGGMGTLLFTIMGLAIMVGAFISYRRNKHNEKM